MIDDPDDVHDRHARAARIHVDARPTVKINPAEVGLEDAPSWPLARAALERLGLYAVTAFRAGLCAQLVRVTCELEAATTPEDRADCVHRARELLEAVAKVLDH